MKILGKEYKVIYKKDAECQGLYGSANRGSALITINKETTKEQQAETLIHEALHIISDELVLGIEEEVIARLAVGLYSAGIKGKAK